MKIYLLFKLAINSSYKNELIHTYLTNNANAPIICEHY